MVVNCISTMKLKTRIVALALVMLGMANFAKAKPVVLTAHKSGGVLGLYNTVYQDFVGQDAFGNRYYNLSCYNPGWTRCRLEPNSLVVPGGGTSYENEITDHMESKTADAIDWIDNEIEVYDEDTGEKSWHHVIQMSDNTFIDIYITAEWRPDPASSGDYIMEITIDCPQLD